MADTAEVRGTALNTSGVPLSRALITARLVSSAEDYPGFAGDGDVVAARSSTRSDEDGSFSLDLVVNADIVPANTLYEISILPSGGKDVVPRVLIIVPGGGPHDIEDLVVNAPGDLPTTNLLDEHRFHPGDPHAAAGYVKQPELDEQIGGLATVVQLDAEEAARIAGDVALTATVATKETPAGAQAKADAAEADAKAYADDGHLETPAAAQAKADAAEADAKAYADDGHLVLASRIGDDVAELVNGLLPTDRLPALAIGTTTPVVSQAAMLALDAQTGDRAVRTDFDPARVFILAGEDPTVLASWIELTATGAVQSVNGQDGVIVLGPADVGAPSIAELTAEALARANADAAEALARANADGLLIPLAQKGADNGVAPLDGDGFVPDIHLPPGVGMPDEVGRVRVPITLPTYDGDTSVTHPDFLFIPDGWTGHPDRPRYICAYTPWPGAHRELPSIAFSHDGENWYLPAGAPNPLTLLNWIQQGDPPPYLWGSDTDIVLLPDNRIAVYWRRYNDTAGNFREQMLRQVSEDGVVWTAPQVCITVVGAAGPDTLLSPAIVVEDDGSFSCYTVNRRAAGGATQMVERRASAAGDGVNFGAPVACTLPGGFDPWHLDVIKAGGRYHMLLNTLGAQGAEFLYYLSSAGGLAFIPPLVSKPLWKSGYPHDALRHYRSGFQAVPGDPLRFHIMVAGMPVNPRVSGPETGGNWRISMYFDVDLDPVQHENASHADGPYVVGAAAQTYLRLTRTYRTHAQGMANQLGVDGRMTATYLDVANNNRPLIAIRIDVTTAGTLALSFVRLGIYMDNGEFFPGALLLDAGVVDSSVTGVRTIVINQALPYRGRYWLVAVPQGAPVTNPTLRSITGQVPGMPMIAGGSSWNLTSAAWRIANGINGALPAQFPTANLDIADAAPMVAVSA